MRRLICWLFGHKEVGIGFGGDSRCTRCDRFWE